MAKKCEWEPFIAGGVFETSCGQTMFAEDEDGGAIEKSDIQGFFEKLKRCPNCKKEVSIDMDSEEFKRLNKED
jgi:hypothetical protein